MARKHGSEHWVPSAAVRQACQAYSAAEKGKVMKMPTPAVDNDMETEAYRPNGGHDVIGLMVPS